MTEMTELYGTPRERVARCVEVLDAEVPNWRALVDRSTLNVAHPSRCVLGQIYGDYHSVAAEDFRLVYGDKRLGLDSFDWDDADALNRAWREELMRTPVVAGAS